MTTPLNLEEKVWYRLVKVIYIFFYIVACLIVALMAYSERPRTFVDSDRSFIICSNGISSAYAAGKHRIGIGADGSVYSWDEPDAHKLCAYGIIDDYRNQYATPPEKNYSVRVAYRHVGSRNAVLKVLVYGFLIVILTLEVIKRTFLYVAVGQPFFGRRRGV